MRFVAAQFLALLDDDLWLDLAGHANSMAARLHAAVSGIDGIDVGPAPAVNSLFPILPADLIAPLQDVVLLLGLGRRPSPGPLDDGVGHHRRRRPGVRRRRAGRV